MTSKLCLVLVEISNPPNPLWQHSLPVTVVSLLCTRQSWTSTAELWVRRGGRVRTENDIKRMSVGVGTPVFPPSGTLCPSPASERARASAAQVRPQLPGTRRTYLLVGVGTPEDMWLTTVSFILVRGRGGLKEREICITLVITRAGGNKRRVSAKDRLPRFLIHAGPDGCGLRNRFFRPT